MLWVATGGCAYVLEKHVNMHRASCRIISYSSRNPGRWWALLSESRTACSSSAALTKLLQESPWYNAALAALQCTSKHVPAGGTCRCSSFVERLHFLSRPGLVTQALAN